MADVSLRTYVFLDSLQPQLASYVGTTSRGFLPTPGVASMFIEIAPGMAVNRLMDVALKASQARPSMMVVERAFGLMEIHHEDKGQVQLGGEAVLEYLGLNQEGRARPRVVSNETIRSIEPYHAQLINRIRYGDMVLPGESLFILETEPAGYASIAANEAEKAANVKLNEVRLFGAFGRLYLSGPEADIDFAAEAALAAVKSIEGVELKKRK